MKLKVSKNIVVNIALFLSLFSGIHAQNASPDCATTTFKLCDTSLFIKANNSLTPQYGSINELFGNIISNPSTNPASSNSGCLLSNEVHPSWSIMEVVSAGTLGFYIATSGNQIGFLDWSLWPYDSLTCNAIITNSLAPVRCNWNASSSGGTGIGPVPTGGIAGNFEPILNVNAGDKFILCLNNYASVVVSSWKFQKIGTASLGCGFTTSIKENNNTVSLNIWPNPSSEKINLTSNDKIGEVLLYNVSGELLKKYDFAANTAIISLMEFASGTFVLKTQSGYHKLIKID